jgi:hypothetical protein
MEARRPKWILSLWLTILFVTACSPRPTTLPTPTLLIITEEPQATVTELPATAEAGSTPIAGQTLCANPYYPVRQGATWSYRSTGGPAGEYSFADTISSVREDGFTLSTQFDDLALTQEWACRPEGLVALQLGGAPAALINSQDMQMNLRVLNASGVTFPNQINPGDQWQHNLDFEGTLAFMGEDGSATGNAATSFAAIGIESVTVPAGSFDALNIQVDTTLNFDVSYEGLSLPVTFSARYNYWFAQDVGWVKTSGSGSMAGQSFSETLELQSYRIP